MKTTITKEFSWGMSHRLEHHEGLCRHIHGHNYKLFVEVTELSTKKKNKSETGMVIDFSRLKEIVNDVIINFFDHSFCFNIKDKETNEIAQYLREKINQKLAPLHYSPTAENLAKDCYDRLAANLKDISIHVVSVTIYETDTSYARYEK